MSKTRFENGINPGQLSADPSGAKAGDTYFNTTLNKTRIYSGIAWSNVGSGSGGGKNYLTDINNNPGNGDFELNSTTGWSLGVTGALTNGLPSATPTFGSGASGNLSISTVSSGQLAGLYSMSYASSAATTVGNMVASDAFTIDLADQAKVLTWKFNYKAQTNPSNVNWSGTSSNSFGVAVYDVTNSAWLPTTASFGMTQSSGVGIASGTVQTASNASQLRLVIYNINATTGAVTLYFDDMSFGPQTAPLGVAATDWVAYTPTFTGFGTVSSVLFYSRRVGDTLEVHGTFASGTPTAVANQITLGFNGINSNVKIDSTKHQANTKCGDAAVAANSTTMFRWQVQAGNVDPYGFVQLGIQTSTGQGVTGGQNGNALQITLGNSVQIDFSVPIVGWSSNVQMSNDTDTRVAAVSINGATPSSTPQSSATVVNFGNTASFDTHGTYATGSGIYTIPVAGIWRVRSHIEVDGTAATNKSVTLAVRKNSSVVNNSTTDGSTAPSKSRWVCDIHDIRQYSAGDTVDITCTANAASATWVPSTCCFSVERLSGPATIAATESVNMRRTNVAGTSIANSGEVVVPFATADFDSHNAFATDTYTVPVSGKYRVSGSALFAAAVYAVGNKVHGIAYKNGAVHSYGPALIAQTTSSIEMGAVVSALINCVAGDTLQFRLFNNRTAGATTLSTAVGTNYISIHRVGN